MSRQEKPPKWEERITMPGRPPIRRTINLEVMRLAEKWSGAVRGRLNDPEVEEFKWMMYDDLMKVEKHFSKLNEESYREKS